MGACPSDSQEIVSFGGHDTPQYAVEFTRKGMCMPTTEITFRGVPYTNTVLFTALVNAFLAGREDVCEQMLADFDEVEFYSPDEWEHETLTQSVSWRHSVRWFDQSRKYWRVPNRDVWREYGDRPKFRPKRKEVK